MLAPSLRSSVRVLTCAPKPRPPGPMKPIRRRSFAPKARAEPGAAKALAATAPAAAVLMKLRRLTSEFSIRSFSCKARKDGECLGHACREGKRLAHQSKSNQRLGVVGAGLNSGQTPE